MTPALVEAAGEFEFRYVPPHGAAPMLLVGALSPMREIAGLDDNQRGAALFLRDGAGGWRAVLPSAWESVIAIYQNGESGETVVFTTVQTEGPGQSWTLVRSSDGFARAQCSRVHFPEELNSPNWSNAYLELVVFAIDAGGRGFIIGRALVEGDGAEEYQLYIYNTRDSGETWRGPHPSRRAPTARVTHFERAEDFPASAGLPAELSEAAAGAAE
jgi:hypothetical protein